MFYKRISLHVLLVVVVVVVVVSIPNSTVSCDVNFTKDTSCNLTTQVNPPVLNTPSHCQTMLTTRVVRFSARKIRKANGQFDVTVGC